MSLKRLLAICLTIAAAMAASSALVSPAQAIVDRDCGDFSSQRAAQIFFLNAGGPHSDPHGLDSDGDGVVCESNGAPYYYGTTPPGSSQPPKPETPKKVASKVALTLNRSKAIAGERLKLTATVRPNMRRPIVFQKRANGRWVAIRRESTTARGVAKHIIAAPARATLYRAFVPVKKAQGKRFAAATSRNRKLSVPRQGVKLTFASDDLTIGDSVKATITSTPVRSGRPVVLQVARDGRWVTLQKRWVNSRGRATATLTPDEEGEFRYRAVAERFHGAKRAYSASEWLWVSN